MTQLLESWIIAQILSEVFFCVCIENNLAAAACKKPAWVAKGQMRTTCLILTVDATCCPHLFLSQDTSMFFS